MDWLGAFLGELLLQTTVGGSVLVGMYYLVSQQYMIAAALLIPLLGVTVWIVSDVFTSNVPDDFDLRND